MDDKPEPKQKKDLKELKELEKKIENALPDDLKELFKEYREIAGEMPKLKVLKDIKMVDKSKDMDLVDKSKLHDVTTTADSLIEVSEPDKLNKEIAAAIITLGLALGRDIGIKEITNVYEDVKDALEKSKTKKD